MTTYLVWPKEQTQKVDMSGHIEKIGKFATVRKRLQVASMLIVDVRPDWETRLEDYCAEHDLEFSVSERKYIS